MARMPFSYVVPSKDALEQALAQAPPPLSPPTGELPFGLAPMTTADIRDQLAKTVVNRGTFVPLVEYGTGEVGFGLPGVLHAPIDAARRMLTPGYDYSNTQQAARDALDAASFAFTGGLAANAAGLVPRGAIGSAGGRPRAATGLRAYHGSPYDFERFDIGRVGTGEGAQQYGHGLYFSDAEDVARKYRRSLSEMPWAATGLLEAADQAAQRVGLNDAEQALLRRAVKIKVAEEEIDPVSAFLPDVLPKEIPANVRVDRLREAAEAMEHPGRMYEVRIAADPDQLLDWDKPLANQSEAVRNAVLPLMREIDRFPASATGQDALRSAQAALGGVGQEQISSLLREVGVPGIRFLDPNARATGAVEGLNNYVIFDDQLIEILRKCGLLPLAALTGAAALGPSTEAQAQTSR